jgi:1-acyl-sn-glycerol-3-phosphate acyltransferase
LVSKQTTQRARKDRLASLLSGLAMAVLLGTLLGIPFWLLALFRVIRISGYSRAMAYMWRGRVLIVANHPSLIETFFIPLVFWPWAIFRLRMFAWSLPDKKLFKSFTPERHERLRCIRVGRDDSLESRKLNWSAMKRVMELFEKEQCFVAHLEGGRTSKQAERVSVGPNEMGRIRNGQILKAAWKKGAWIMPLHVGMTHDMRRDLPGFGESLRRLLFSPKCWPVRLEFRQPYRIVGQKFDEEAEKRRLELAILTPAH